MSSKRIKITDIVKSKMDTIINTQNVENTFQNVENVKLYYSWTPCNAIPAAVSTFAAPISQTLFRWQNPNRTLFIDEFYIMVKALYVPPAAVVYPALPNFVGWRALINQKVRIPDIENTPWIFPETDIGNMWIHPTDQWAQLLNLSHPIALRNGDEVTTQSVNTDLVAYAFCFNIKGHTERLTEA